MRTARAATASIRFDITWACKWPSSKAFNAPPQIEQYVCKICRANPTLPEAVYRCDRLYAASRFKSRLDWPVLSIRSSDASMLSTCHSHCNSHCNSHCGSHCGSQCSSQCGQYNSQYSSPLSQSLSKRTVSHTHCLAQARTVQSKGAQVSGSRVWCLGQSGSGVVCTFS